ncbi:hypothetical protein [Spirosoma telluris]
MIFTLYLYQAIGTMITIKNKFILLAAGFWLSGIVLILLGAGAKSTHADLAGTLLSIGILAQALGFGFLGFAIMQAVLKKK